MMRLRYPEGLRRRACSIDHEYDDDDPEALCENMKDSTKRRRKEKLQRKRVMCLKFFSTILIGALVIFVSSENQQRPAHFKRAQLLFDDSLLTTPIKGLNVVNDEDYLDKLHPDEQLLWEKGKALFKQGQPRVKSDAVNANITIAEIKDAFSEPASWEYPDIDVVYTWVNGSDPVWLERKEAYHEQFLQQQQRNYYSEGKGGSISNFASQMFYKLANGNKRFNERKELLYSLRSVEKYAPWVRNIYIVVADLEGQVPIWLQTAHPKIHIIPHCMIVDKKFLPTFGSRVLDTNLDNIPGLSDYFLYFNDDMFLNAPVTPKDYFPDKTSGNHIVFLTKPIQKQCADKCEKEMLSNKQCDMACFNPNCGWDNGDCEGEKRPDNQEVQTPTGYAPYSNTLQYIDSVYNNAFGPSRLEGERMEPMHYPYFWSRKLIGDLKKRLPDEFKKTQNHRFRLSNEMCLPFSYIYYMDAVRVYAPTAQQLMYAAVQSSNEHQKQQKDSKTEFLYGDVSTFIWDPNEKERHDSVVASASYQKFQNCTTRDGINMESDCISAVSDLIHKENIRLPVHEMLLGDTDESCHFTSLNSFTTVTRHRLREIQNEPRRFNTINDDTFVSRQGVDDALHNMFEELFPEPSSFELQQ